MIAIIEFIMLVGLPASGKSTYAEKLKEQGYHIHSSDAIREELIGDANSQDKNADVFTVLHKRVKNDLSKGISCVYDATNMSMKRRKAFLDDIKKYGCRKVCMVFIAPVELCKGRNLRRERQVPDEVFDKMLKSFWMPMYYEGWDRIDFVTEKNFKYYYIYDHSDGEFKESQRYYNLMMAALNHDIGKVFTQTFVDTKGNITEDAHYYGHESYGTYIYLLSELCSTPDVDVESKLYDIVYRSALINWHMRPLTAWKNSEKSRARDRKLIGEDMYNDIMLLHKADLAAH